MLKLKGSGFKRTDKMIHESTNRHDFFEYVKKIRADSCRFVDHRGTFPSRQPSQMQPVAQPNDSGDLIVF